MVLNYDQIIELCQSENPLVTPFDRNLVNPASIDIRVGDRAKVDDGEGARLWDIDLNDYHKDKPYPLSPGEFALVSSLEVFCIPDNCAGEVRLKSSRVREGYDLSLALWLDPGWHGILTVAMRNNRNGAELPLYPGLKFAQVILHRLDHAPTLTYRETV